MAGSDHIVATRRFLLATERKIVCQEFPPGAAALTRSQNNRVIPNHTTNKAMPIAPACLSLAVALVRAIGQIYGRNCSRISSGGKRNSIPRAAARCLFENVWIAPQVHWTAYAAALDAANLSHGSDIRAGFPGRRNGCGRSLTGVRVLSAQ